MKRLVLRIVVPLWQGWYISGRMCESFGYRDTAREELHDIINTGGGKPIIIAGVFCFGILLARKWCEQQSLRPSVLRNNFRPLTLNFPKFALVRAVPPTASPPLPLRIEATRVLAETLTVTSADARLETSVLTETLRKESELL